MSGFGFTSNKDNESHQNQKPSCRICFSSNENLMPSPCNCSGSLGYVHKRCFRRWMRTVRNSETCEICHERYGKGTVISKRSFRKLFMAFFERPFHALCKFVLHLGSTAMFGYILHSRKLPVIFKFLLADVNEESSIAILFPIFVMTPVFAAYCCSIEHTALSFHKFLSASYEWWNYSWITDQMSDESIDGTTIRSRADSNDDLTTDDNGFVLASFL